MKQIKNTLKLPFNFESAKLQSDLALLTDQDWVEHFNKQNFTGKWRIAPLRGPANETHPIRLAYPDPSAKEFVDLPLLKKCENFFEVLQQFKCNILSVRLMSLAPGSEIKEHVDHELGFEYGEIRIHIPVKTNPDVVFIHNGNRVVMNEGECWYLNFSLPHSLSNGGGTERIHLVIDCKVNTWLSKFFE